MEVFEFALKMEADGEKYYRNLAESAEDTGLNRIFNSLAEDEATHYRIIRTIMDGGMEKVDLGLLEREKNVFEKLEKDSMPKADVRQVEAYRHACGLEKESVELYKKLAENADEKGKKLFGMLVEEEQRHFDILEDIVLLLNRASEWVESPEFNKKEAY